MKVNKMKKRTIKQNINLLFRAIKEINTLSPKLLLSTIIFCFCNALFPFVSIYLLAYIASELSNKSTISISYIITILFLNFILFVLKEIFSGINKYSLDMLYGNELNSVTIELLNSDYESIDNPSFQSKISKHHENLNQTGGALTILANIFSTLFSGTISIFCSIAILIPFLKLLILGNGVILTKKTSFFTILLISITIGAVFIFLISLMSNKKIFKLQNKFYDINNIFNYYTDILTDYKNGKEIRIFKTQKLIENQIVKNSLKQGLNLQKKIGYYEILSNSSIIFVCCVLGLCIYLVIGLKGLSGVISISAIIRYLGSFLQLAQGINSLSSNLGKLGNIIPSLCYYFDIFDNKSPKTSNSPQVCPKDDFLIEFKNVSFMYPNSNKYALKNVSFKIKTGESIAIVGENGSGKTTIVNLLCRLYTVESGAIYLNGVNITEYNMEDYRNLLSVVFQDFNIFSLPLGETIASNIKYDEKKLEYCLKEVDIYNRIQEFPYLYKTYLYKDCDANGIEISGGEAQKLAISRAIYKNAPIMILDEPTASLDPFAEHNIYTKFHDLMKSKTTIYISHRLSSCRFCSKVIVMDAGQILQIGSHNELINDLTGKYYSLWNSQSKYYIS